MSTTIYRCGGIGVKTQNFVAVVSLRRGAPKPQRRVVVWYSHHIVKSGSIARFPAQWLRQ